MSVEHAFMDGARFSRSDCFIAVMGVTGAGKSTFISKCCKKAEDTQTIQLYTFTHNNRTIHLIDTPGFDDTDRSDSEILRDLVFFLTSSYGKGFRLTGIVYLHPITTTRMSGAALKNLRIFRKLCERDSMSLVIMVTTMWDNMDPSERERQEMGREERATRGREGRARWGSDYEDSDEEGIDDMSDEERYWRFVQTHIDGDDWRDVLS